MKKEISIESCALAQGPYVQGLVYNNMIYASQIGIDKYGNLAKGGIQQQTRQIMENFKLILESQGSGMDKVIQCTIYIVNMEDVQLMNRIYSEYFTKPYPSRCCVQVAGMSDGALVEMSLVAAL
ncbi:MAG: Rid family hydrolase [Clostridium sp.]|jgi:2-iminobutanoate/2-iminopropanoate deaminase|uniref:Rid family hydrolase n=1 Tax=Clostridium sp. TaxID=1506 RepID=UPI0025C6E504|nr:Rid family hydrolase [Clostridium sp.]MCH3964447.1 Rid family hydrolase [Clostridium sp.]MCI1715622.1 Rid family hydrolase [Clostridium sp.]MCI1799586.1 Rid family hydrolase [Clostridium sp.]MCI1813806.1 Rid family hydrolase [Clostridium sp.]MCI1870399.1 Rid family hydrolase [Clostridium sp.]